MRDPSNERQAQPHLQRMADLKYLKHERSQVRPSYTESDWRQVINAVASYVGPAIVIGALGFVWWAW